MAANLPKSSAGTASAAGPSFRIRPARRGDSEALGQLLRELGYPGAGDTQTVHWVISHPEMEILVATDGQDKPIGMLSMSHRPQLRMKGRIATIDELVVTDAWRKKGVGRELVRRAIERAKVLSVKRIELVTHSQGEEIPRHFYKSCGFEESASAVMRLPTIDFVK